MLPLSSLSYVRLSLKTAHFPPSQLPQIHPPKKGLFSSRFPQVFCQNCHLCHPSAFPSKKFILSPIDYLKVYTQNAPSLSLLIYFSFSRPKARAVPSERPQLFPQKSHRAVLPGSCPIPAQFSSPPHPKPASGRLQNPLPSPAKRIAARLAAVPLAERRSGSAAIDTAG